MDDWKVMAFYILMIMPVKYVIHHKKSEKITKLGTVQCSILGFARKDTRFW